MHVYVIIYICVCVYIYIYSRFTGTTDKNIFKNGEVFRTAGYKPRRSRVETKAQMTARQTQSVGSNTGLHESWQWYDKCVIRRRNGGTDYSYNYLTLLHILIIFGPGVGMASR